jgi:hypothetical protein
MATDLGDRAPADVAPDARVRVRIEQVSAVEQASVLGTPVLEPDGRPAMAAGSGRPLVLTTLEMPEAMRVLARGNLVRPRLAAACFVLGLALVAASILVAGVLALGPSARTAFAADPSALSAAGASAPPIASPLATRIGGDTRSSGEGPGLVGAPGLAIAAVLGIGVLAVVGTLGYVRLTKPRSGGPKPRR